ncbi:MAG: FtsX-like permease family protein [Parashewanella sp.]
MLNNYVIAALRAFNRQKKHTLLNLFGLSIGLAAAILVALFVNFERSYDRFQPNFENTYRVSQYFIPIGATAPISSPALKNHISNIAGIDDVFTLNLVGVVKDSNLEQVSINGEYLKLDDIYAASPNIEDFIHLDVLDGDLNQALTQPDNLALTKSEAIRLFGKQDVIGKTLQRKKGKWTIAAVIDDLPNNSHFFFKSLTYVNPAIFGETTLRDNSSYNYLRINNPDDIASISSQLENLINESAYGGNQVTKITLQPLADIHLTSHSRYELKQGGSKTTVIICIGLSVLLIVIVSVNFINMSIAQASQRAKEVGVRKALGASRTQLVTQFLSESILLSAIAAVIACAIVELSLPWFNVLIERELTLHYLSSFSAFIVAITIAVGLVAGLYPALFISSFSAKRVLSGDLQRGKTAIWVRKSLLVLQSAMSIALIIGAMTLYQQLQLLNSLQVGYQKQHKLLVSNLPRDELFFENNSALLNEIQRLPGVNSVSTIDSDLTHAIGSSIQFYWQDGSEQGEVLPFIGAGYNIAKTQGFNIIAGRDFSSKFASDWYSKQDDGSHKAAILITRSLAKQAGFQNPQDALGQVWRFNGKDQATVVGVIDNLKVGSVKEAALPTVIICGISFQAEARLVIDFEPLQFNQIKQSVKQIIQNKLNVAASDIELLSNNYEAVYRSERQLSQLVIIFTNLAIVLTCVGILGLASFSALRRSKEVAIRKVLGDTVLGLINLLAKEFLILVLISVVIAFPVTYWLVDDWLNNFNDRVSQSISAYGLAVGLIFGFTWLTVASIAYKVASSRPSGMLRYE